MLALCLCCTVEAQTSHSIVAEPQVPSTLVGNWINETTNDWEYGFFEEFAIYQCRFWEYESVKTKGKKTTFVLRQGDELVTVEITRKSNSSIDIKNGKQKKQKYALMQKQYPVYKSKDTAPFPALEIKEDSATIIGYCRNLDLVPEKYEDLLSGYFEVSLFDFAQGKTQHYRAHLDPLGRFRITVPIVHLQEVLAGFELKQSVVLQPNDMLFLFADFSDFTPRAGGPQQILFMGQSARLNNEIVRYQALKPEPSIDMPYERQINNVEGMPLLRLQEQVYNEQTRHFDAYLAQHPSLSTRFVSYMRDAQLYGFALALMELYYGPYDDTRDPRFAEGYVEYIHATFPFDYEKFYTSSAQLFWEEYMGYMYKIGSASHHEMMTILIDTMIARELISSDISSDVADINNRFKKLLRQRTAAINDSLHVQTAELFTELLESLGSLRYLKHVYTVEQLMWEISLQQGIKLVDALFTAPIFKELGTAAIYYEKLDSDLPLTPNELRELDARITNPYLHQRILSLHNQYSAANLHIEKYADCLKSADHLADIEDANELLEQIIAPYRGKYIVIDFWSVWDGVFTDDVSPEARTVDDMAFIFLANDNSSEQVWREHIIKKNLLGEDVAHYRLPYHQQRLLMEHFSILHVSLPTYVCINREGEIENPNVPLDSEDFGLWRVIGQDEEADDTDVQEAM